MEMVKVKMFTFKVNRLSLEMMIITGPRLLNKVNSRLWLTLRPRTRSIPMVKPINIRTMRTKTMVNRTMAWKVDYENIED